MPPGFSFPAGSELWVPREQFPRYPSRTAQNWQAVGRLADGVTLEQARVDLSTIARRLRQQYGDDTWMTDAAVVPLQEAIVGPVRDRAGSRGPSTCWVSRTTGAALVEASGS